MSTFKLEDDLAFDANDDSSIQEENVLDDDSNTNSDKPLPSPETPKTPKKRDPKLAMQVDGNSTSSFKLVYEIAKAAEKIDWNAVAEKSGYANAGTASAIWRRLKKRHDGAAETSPLKPKAEKVTKAKSGRKKKAPKDLDD